MLYRPMMSTPDMSSSHRNPTTVSGLFFALHFWQGRRREKGEDKIEVTHLVTDWRIDLMSSSSLSHCSLVSNKWGGCEGFLSHCQLPFLCLGMSLIGLSTCQKLCPKLHWSKVVHCGGSRMPFGTHPRMSAGDQVSQTWCVMEGWREPPSSLWID